MAKVAGALVEGAFVTEGEAALSAAREAKGWRWCVDAFVKFLVFGSDLEGGGTGCTGFGLGHIYRLGFFRAEEFTGWWCLTSG